MRFDPRDPASAYPSRLHDVDDKPVMTVSGPLEAERVVAIVGSRRPTTRSREIAASLATDLARAGVTIVSGGATGVDAAAHAAALDAGGATWVVCPHGPSHTYPPQNRPLFCRIRKSPASRMIWPFEDDPAVSRHNFLARNKVLVGLADAVVVVQARKQSGSKNAARWAISYKRPLWVVTGDLDDSAFDGSRQILAMGGRPLLSTPELFESLGLPPPHRSSRPPKPVLAQRREQKPLLFSRRQRLAAEPSQEGWSTVEKVIFSRLSAAPQHVDDLIAKVGLGASSTVTALLTLSLKDVVVEGPDGFFRRATSG